MTGASTLKLFKAQEIVYFATADLHLGICAADHRPYRIVRHFN
jgi:hypothetical protein